MKKYLPVIVAVGIIAVGSCKKAEVAPIYSEWTYAKGDHYQSGKSTFTSQQLESDCDNNNKMWIILSSSPNTATGSMKIVSYGKTTVADDEIKIDIAHGSDDYLSTGNDNKLATVSIVNGKLQVHFDAVSFARNTGGSPAGDSTTITGYLNQE